MIQTHHSWNSKTWGVVYSLKSKTPGLRAFFLHMFKVLDTALWFAMRRFQRLVIQDQPMDLEEKRVQEGLDRAPGNPGNEL